MAGSQALEQPFRDGLPHRFVLVPGVLALLPEYAGLEDPIADLRAACHRAVSWLVESGVKVAVHSDHQGLRIAEHLISAAGGSAHPLEDSLEAVLVVGNGSARRSERAPGHLDARALAFDESLRRALSAPDPQALTGLDRHLGADLLADIDSISWLGEVLSFDHKATIDYDADPFGVQYWVMRWTCAS